MKHASFPTTFFLIIGHLLCCNGSDYRSRPITLSVESLRNLLGELQDQELTDRTIRRLQDALVEFANSKNQNLMTRIDQLHAENHKLTVQLTQSNEELNKQHDNVMLSVDGLRGQVYSHKSRNEKLAQSNQELMIGMDEAAFQIGNLTSENGRLAVEVGSYKLEIQRLTQQIEARHARITALEGEPREHGMVDERTHCDSVLKWSFIMGAVILLTTSLVLCCGFRIYYLNRKKQWEIQRLRRLLSVQNDYRKADEIIEAHRRVSEEIQQEIEGASNLNKSAQEAVDGDTAGRQFNDLMVNSAAVQVVLMDDVVEEMKTEGGDDGGRPTKRG